MDKQELTPDEVVLQPDDYDLPGFCSGWAKAHVEKMKQPVKVTRRQMQFFGERGVQWRDIERFYGVSRTTLMRYYALDYEKGLANINTALKGLLHEALCLLKDDLEVLEGLIEDGGVLLVCVCHLVPYIRIGTTNCPLSGELFMRFSTSARSRVITA